VGGGLWVSTIKSGNIVFGSNIVILQAESVIVNYLLICDLIKFV
jgi:hypothetical protein